jgi:hypothetical protein
VQHLRDTDSVLVLSAADHHCDALFGDAVMGVPRAPRAVYFALAASRRDCGHQLCIRKALPPDFLLLSVRTAAPVSTDAGSCSGASLIPLGGPDVGLAMQSVPRGQYSTLAALHAAVVGSGSNIVGLGCDTAVMPELGRVAHATPTHRIALTPLVRGGAGAQQAKAKRGRTGASLSLQLHRSTLPHGHD